MFELVDKTASYLTEGKLQDPDPTLYPHLPTSAEGGVVELVALLFEFVGYDGESIPQLDPSFFESDDYGTGYLSSAFGPLTFMTPQSFSRNAVRTLSMTNAD